MVEVCAAGLDRLKRAYAFAGRSDGESSIAAA